MTSVESSYGLAAVTVIDRDNRAVIATWFIAQEGRPWLICIMF